MTGHVDHVVGAAHDPQVTVFILEAGVAGQVVARVLGQVAVDEALVVVPQGRQAARRQRQLDHDVAHLAGRHLLAFLVEDLHVVARHGHGRRTRLDLHRLDTQRVGGDAPGGFGLPPVIDHRLAELVARPEQGVRVATLAGKEQRIHAREIVFLQVLAFRVFFLDRTERGRCGEQHLHAVFLDHAPERARVRGADRLAFVHHGGAAGEQRRVHDVAVADDPADVRGSPVHITGLDVVDVLHGPVHGHGVTAVVTHHAFRLTGGAGGVEDVQRIGRLDRHAIGGRCGFGGGGPVDVAAFDHRSGCLRARVDHALARLVGGNLDRLVEQRLVLDHAVRLDAAGGRDDDFRLRVIHAGCQLVGREAAEHHRVDRAQARACQHGNRSFRDHRHINQYAVALLHALIAQHAGEFGDCLGQLRVGISALAVGDRGIVDQRQLITAAGFDVTIQRVVSGVEQAAAEPARHRLGIQIQDLVPGFVPVQLGSCFAPECLWVLQGLLVKLLILAHRPCSPQLGI